MNTAKKLDNETNEILEMHYAMMKLKQDIQQIQATMDAKDRTSKQELKKILADMQIRLDDLQTNSRKITMLLACVLQVRREHAQGIIGVRDLLDMLDRVANSLTRL